MKRILFVSLLALTNTALAGVEDTQPVSSPQYAVRYSLSVEEAKLDDEKSQVKWAGLKYGDLSASVSSDLKYHLVDFASTVGRTLQMEKWAPEFLKNTVGKLQIEGHAGNAQAAYAVLGAELPVYKPFTFFAAGVMTDKKVRPVGGPIFYWSQSHTMLMVYPSCDKTEVVDDKLSLALRTRVREFDKVKLDFDLTTKWATVDGKDEFKLGGGAGVQVGFLGARFSYAPLKDASKANVTKMEAFVETAL